MQALAGIASEVGLAAGLVMPRPIARARLHGRQNMHKARRIASLSKHLLHQRLLADVAFADMLNLNPGRSTNFQGTCSNALTQWLGKLGVVKDADAPAVQETGHAACVARPRHRAGDHHAVVARQYSVQVGRVTSGQLCFHDFASSVMTSNGITCLVPARPA